MILTLLYTIFSYTIYPIIIGYKYIKTSFYNLTYSGSYYLYKKHDNELYEYYMINPDTNSLYYYMLKREDHADHRIVLNNMDKYNNYLLNASLYTDETNIIDITPEFKKFVYYIIKYGKNGHHVISSYIKKLYNLNQPYYIEIMHNDDDFSTIKIHV